MSIRDQNPLYTKVIEQIKRNIELEIWKPNDKLPSEPEMAKLFGVSRATLREALRFLEEENVINRKHGVGSFVRSKPPFSSGIEELFSITEMIKRAGYNPGTIFQKKELVSPLIEEMKALQITNKQKILRIERVRTANNEPVVFCIDKIPIEIIPEQFYNFLIESDSMFVTFEKYTEQKIIYADTSIIPVGYNDTINSILNTDLPLLLLKQTHYNQNNEPILLSVNYFRSDKFSFQVLRKRQGI